MRLQHFLSRDGWLGRWWLRFAPVQEQLVVPARHGLPLQCLQRGLHILLAKPLEQRVRRTELHGVVGSGRGLDMLLQSGAESMEAHT